MRLHHVIFEISVVKIGAIRPPPGSTFYNSMVENVLLDLLFAVCRSTLDPSWVIF